MESKEAELVTSNHTLFIPYGYLLFGKIFETPLECAFSYSKGLDKNHTIEILSLVGVGSDGLLYDMSYLVEEGGTATEHIIGCILNNHSNWDKDSKRGPWWNIAKVEEEE